MILRLLEGGADVSGPDGDGWFPLYIASQSNRVDAARALLSSGADVHQATKIGWTPLHVACRDAASGGRADAPVGPPCAP